jgi:hypothetical protein
MFFFCIVILYVCLCVEVMGTLQILWWIPGARLQFCARVMRAWSPKGETIPDSRFFCIAVLDCNCRWMVDFCGGSSVIFLYIFQIFLWKVIVYCIFNVFIYLQKHSDHCKNLEKLSLWGGMLCSCSYGLVSLCKSYLRLYFVRICLMYYLSL